MKCASKLSLCLIVFFAPFLLNGASFLVPTDRELIDRADAIVVGTVVGSRSQIDKHGNVVTVHSLAVSDVLKGSQLPVVLEISEPGGVVGDIGVAVSGAAIYQLNDRHLVFLEKTEDGFRTWGMALGRFAFTPEQTLTRGEIFGWAESDGSAHVEKPRNAALFLDFIHALVRGVAASDQYFVERISSDASAKIGATNHIAASTYAVGADQGPNATRRIFGSVTYNASGSPSAAETNAVVKAMNTWTNDTNSAISIRFGAVTTAGFDTDCGGGCSDGQNTIVFNSTKGISGSLLGFSFWRFFTTTHTHNGSTFNEIIEADISVKASLSGSQLESVVAHEVGHTLGIRHADRPSVPSHPNTPQALMALSTPASFAGALQPWDREAANHLYGNGTLCFVPTINSQPQGQAILSGQNATLSVAAAGINPISYQWFRGNAGDTSSPVGTNASTFNTGPLSATTTFWVQVRNDCGPVNSAAATITVTACTSPNITVQPQNASVLSGQSANLTVGATGTAPLSYDWYRGTQPDTSSGVIGSSQTLNTGPLTTTTSFWVRVRNACGQMSSNTATVTVTTSCVAPTITTHPQSATIQSGTTALLSVSASGTSLTYEWYRGTAPDTSSGVLGTASTFETPTLTSTTSFWVRVRNSCGTRDSNTATLAVPVQCPLPAVSPQLSTPNTSPTANSAIVVNWATSEAVDSYHVQISTDPGFNSDVHNLRAPGSARNVFFVLATPHVYHVRIFAENSCGVREGAQRLTLNVGPEPARVVLVATTSGMIQSPGQASTDSFTLANFGGTATSISVGRRGSFFSVSPESFALAPGARQLVSIQAVSQPLGNHEGAAIPTGNGVPAGLEVPVRLLVAEQPVGNPNLVPAANRLDVSGGAGDIVTGSLQFTNNGTAPVRGMLVSDVPWLIPQQGFVEALPGQSVTLNFTINRTLRAITQGSEIGTLSIVYLAGVPGKITPAGSAPPPGSKTTVVTVSDTVKPVVTASGIPPLPADEVALFVPGVGHVQGGSGLFISDVSILNTSTIESLRDLKIFFTPTSTAPETAKSATYTNVPANRSLNLADISKSVFNSEQQVGSLQVRVNKQTPISINANIFNVANPAGTYGTALPVLRSDRAAEAQQKLFLTGLRKDATGRTNLYIQETSGAFGTAQVEFLNAQGVVLGSQTANVTPYGLTQMLDALPAGAVSVVVTNTSGGSAKILAHATPVDQASGDTWSIADWSRQYQYDVTQPVVVPVAGKLPGGNNSDFRTDVTIMNTGTAPASGTLRYYTGGNVMDRPLAFTARESRVLTDVVGTLFGISTTSVGFLVFTPAGSGTFAVSSRTYTLAAQGSTFGTGVPTLSAAASLKTGEVRKIAGIQDAAPSTSGSAKPGTYRTNLGLVETTGNPVTVRATMRYTAVQGAASASGIAFADYAIGANQLRLINGITGSILGDSRALFGEIHDIQVDFEVVGGNGQALVFVTSTDNGTNDTALRVE